MTTALYLGIDLGTSGCRAVAIDENGRQRASAAAGLPAPRRDGERCEQDPDLWWQAVCEVLRALLAQVPATTVRAIAVDGTSASLLLSDEQGEPLGPALMYNDARAVAQAKRIAAGAPPATAAQGPASALAKLLWLRDEGLTRPARHALHQADWISARLSGRAGVSDQNNALKLGYDPLAESWPDWLDALGVPRNLLPEVVPPGTPIGPLRPALARSLGLPAETLIVAGTTDSTAAFLATGAARPGEAVTCLGSTLVLKVICEQPVFDATHGVYSQPLFLDGRRLWLAGGASNSGGAVLRQFFSDAQMRAMTPRLRPQRRTCLAYYPLPGPGERFPVNDPRLPPRLTPRPHDDVRFFQALLEAIAGIESRGYRLLRDLGAPYPVNVRSTGGGAKNPAWERIRGDLLKVPMIAPHSGDAAYGSALLARRAGRTTPTHQHTA